MRSPVELETKIDHCPRRHQHIIFIKECDNCEIVTVGRWKLPPCPRGRVQVLGTHQPGYLCVLCWAGTPWPPLPDRRSVCLCLLPQPPGVWSGGWSLAWIMSLLTFLPHSPARQRRSSILTSIHSEKMPRSLLMLSHFQNLLNYSAVDLCYAKPNQLNPQWNWVDCPQNLHQ